MMFQYTRTKNIKQKTENLKDLFFENYIKLYLKSEFAVKNPNIDSSILDKIKLDINGLHSNSILMGLTSPITIADLGIALLINETKKDFIFSDSPVVLHNTIFNNLKNAGTRGFASKGLQIFYPLNNELMLMFYDSGVYEILTHNIYNIKIKSEKEINKINLLQFIYSDQNLYFSRSNQSNYVTKLFSEIRGKIKKWKVGINIYRNANDPLRELHQVIEEKIEFSQSLSFLKLNNDLKYDNGICETSLHELNNSFVDEILKRNRTKK